jgi:hypothetical protein
VFAGVDEKSIPIYRDIPVDACIAEIIEEIWDNGVQTLESCCGHGLGGEIGEGYIMLKHNAPQREVDIVSRILKKHGRDIPILSWMRVTRVPSS